MDDSHCSSANPRQQQLISQNSLAVQESSSPASISGLMLQHQSRCQGMQQPTQQKQGQCAGILPLKPPRAHPGASGEFQKLQRPSTGTYPASRKVHNPRSSMSHDGKASPRSSSRGSGGLGAPSAPLVTVQVAQTAPRADHFTPGSYNNIVSNTVPQRSIPSGCRSHSIDLPTSDRARPRRHSTLSTHVDVTALLRTDHRSGTASGAFSSRAWHGEGPSSSQDAGGVALKAGLQVTSRRPSSIAGYSTNTPRRSSTFKQQQKQHQLEAVYGSRGSMPSACANSSSSSSSSCMNLLNSCRRPGSAAPVSMDTGWASQSGQQMLLRPHTVVASTPLLLADCFRPSTAAGPASISGVQSMQAGARPRTAAAAAVANWWDASSAGLTCSLSMQAGGTDYDNQRESMQQQQLWCAAHEIDGRPATRNGIRSRPTTAASQSITKGQEFDDAGTNHAAAPAFCPGKQC